VSKQFSGRERTRPCTSRQQEALSSMDEFDWRGRDLTTLLDSTAQLLVWALNVKFCQMVQYAADRRSLILRASAGWRNEAAASRNTRIEAGVGSFAGFTLISNRATTFETLAEEHGFRPSPILTDHHVVSGAGVVIGGGSSPFGAICVFSDRPHHFDTHELAFLRSAADIILHAAQPQKESRRHESAQFAQPKTACGCNRSDGSRNLDANTDLSPLGAPFSANVSHEIRTPLNIILGYSELIEEQLAAKGCAELAPYVDAVRRAGQRLLHTVEEILDLSKIGTDSLELKPVEFFLGPMLK
jgi:His Kinase A (phospho-acceptor) domain